MGTCRSRAGCGTLHNKSAAAAVEALQQQAPQIAERFDPQPAAA
tara:strand:+ start:2735 stop:2866 length:132 start_codon:yes stop_codon:yes gene_type:complete